jgi:hypothetical protein
LTCFSQGRAGLREHHAIPRPALLVAVIALLPFLVLLILIWLPFAAVSRQWLATAFLSYGALLLALMGGAHWALATGPYGKARIAREWLIGLGALLIAWMSLNLPPHSGFLLLIAAFFLLMMRDALIAEAGGMPLWFATLRSYVAAAAIVTSILTLIRILI